MSRAGLPKQVEDELIAEYLDEVDGDDLADYFAGRPDLVPAVLEQMPSLDLDLLWPQLVAVARRRGVKGA